MISFAFFASGFAALVYQVVWERALFALFGITSESVAMVVTAFMLGLGLGGLLGGSLSRDPRRRPLLLFAAAELGTGLFGLASLGLFRSVSAVTTSYPPLATGVVAFALLLVPTLLMGATLPLLSAHLVRSGGVVGDSVGRLYSVNTLGSGIASFAAAFVLLAALGQTGSVRVAVATNAAVAATAWFAWRRSE